MTAAPVPHPPEEPPDSGAFRRQLRREVAQWQADGLISGEQAAAILRRYPPGVDGRTPGARSYRRFVLALSVLGAVLVGLGVITFFAANWGAIPSAVKLGMAIGGVLLCYGAGFALLQRRRPASGIGLMLLGGITFGAAVHLIGQSYNMELNHPNLTLFWLLGVAPLAYIVRATPLAALSLLLLLAAAGFRLAYWMDGLPGDGWPVLPAAFYVCLGALLYAVGRVKAQFGPWQAIGAAFQLAGLLTALSAIYSLSFYDGFRDSDWQRAAAALTPAYWAAAYTTAALAVALLLAVGGTAARRDGIRRALPELADGGAALLLLAAVLVVVQRPPAGPLVYPVLFNALLSLTLLGLLAAGYLRRQEGLVNLALLFIAILVLTRYFEYGLSLLNSSLVFTGAGLLLLLGGFLLEWWRRRIVGGLRARPPGGATPDSGETRYSSETPPGGATPHSPETPPAGGA